MLGMKWDLASPYFRKAFRNADVTAIDALKREIEMMLTSVDMVFGFQCKMTELDTAELVEALTNHVAEHIVSTARELADEQEIRGRMQSEAYPSLNAKTNTA